MDKVKLYYLALHVLWNAHFQRKEHSILKMCYFCLTVVWKLYLLGDDAAWNHNAGFYLSTKRNSRNHAEYPHLRWCTVFRVVWGSFEKQPPPPSWPRKGWLGTAPVSTDEGVHLSNCKPTSFRPPQITASVLCFHSLGTDFEFHFFFFCHSEYTGIWQIMWGDWKIILTFSSWIQSVFCQL